MPITVFQSTMQQFQNLSKTQNIQFTATNDKKRQIHTFEKLQPEKVLFFSSSAVYSYVYSSLKQSQSNFTIIVCHFL